jgi:hypothetical protein
MFFASPSVVVLQPLFFEATVIFSSGYYSSTASPCEAASPAAGGRAGNNALSRLYSYENPDHRPLDQGRRLMHAGSIARACSWPEDRIQL